MASVRTNFVVGIFVILGICIITVVVIYVGATSYFQGGRIYEAYFDESVQGLNKDSPVKYRGVSIGKVHDIHIAKDARLIKVLLRIESDWKPGSDVVAQIKSIGITGIMFVELDQKKPGDILLEPSTDNNPDHPLIPTKSSEIRQLLDSLTDIMDQVKALDLSGISSSLKQTITTVDQTVKDADVKIIANRLKKAVDRANAILNDKRWDHIMAVMEQTGGNLNAFAQNANTTATTINTLVTDNREQIDMAIHELKTAMAQADRLMAKGTLTLDSVDTSISRLEKNLAATLRHLEEVGKELGNLTTKSADQPSQLLFAAPPPGKPIEHDN
ncbi:MAG: MlaD family protein [Thermodesulfobacteriota bacterium]|nr:MlaD family protein [Thermodesulfobacteriota bacterium]